MATRPSGPAKSLPLLANRGARTLYTTVLVVVGCALLWLSLANATALVLGKKNPALVMRLGLPSAETKALLALSIATNKPAMDQLPQARQLAQAALRREPVNATAAVALGLIATVENKTDLGRKLIDYSEHVSRRNGFAQLWMIEDRVARGDIPGALNHYDRAMSVSPALRPTLVPILVQASADPAIARSLAITLSHRPLWWTDALTPIIYQGPAPAVTLPIMLHQLKLRSGNDQERTLLSAAMRRLADAGAFSQAEALYQEAGGRPPTRGNNVRNGGFEEDGLLAPFDWDLHVEAGLSATVQLREGGGRALFLSTDGEHQGEMARQLLLLKPGRYRLTAIAGDIAGDHFERPQIRLLCAAAEPHAILDVRLGAASAAGARSQSDFDVPASNCVGQWLVIVSGMSEQALQSDPWIDQVTINPLG
jgi:tetratricopeptide (TPR) repeat protein